MFNGMIDNVNVHDKVLSAREILRSLKMISPNVILFPLNVMLGQHGNAHLSKHAIGAHSNWALRELFVVCVRVAFWCIVEMAKRLFE